VNDKMVRLWATRTRDDEWWSSFVTAPLAVLGNYAVVEVAWLTPNLLTLTSFVTAIVAAVLIVVGGTVNFVIAALLIHASHIFDCMDGQLARYRGMTSAAGSFFDRVTDQIQVTLWFGAVGYAAYNASSEVLPVFLAMVGIAFYSLRGYAKYVAIHVEMSRDSEYLQRMASEEPLADDRGTHDHRLDLRATLRWLFHEQRKIVRFDEGVFVFMLALALVLNRLTPMLWIFAASQLYYGLFRTWQRGRNIQLDQQIPMAK
jgi:phosphatidylglycerophosphate synthase